MNIEDLRIGMTVYHRDDGEHGKYGKCTVYAICSDQGVKIWRPGRDEYLWEDSPLLSLTPFEPGIPERHTHYLDSEGDVIEFFEGHERAVYDRYYKQGNAGTKEAMARKRDFNEALAKVNDFADSSGVEWNDSNPSDWGVVLYNNNSLTFQRGRIHFAFRHKPFKSLDLAKKAIELFPNELKTILTYNWE